ncbi:aminoglycoside adenylyltransferase family protein [Verrucosispora sp. WMMC514]|uniref:aminoglycoside adenylyltransferase family protein n=1 Tax=Verrucosispora sp. WMMC514 TaxID=3015156 RepID=UPI00248AD41E|nr:aminoglycoside adenylyltransferase family protein [Verrucosispora sp. WMMC514]WBB90710.1 aminoglycoside adenylyltransferase family protein [Verrucosispora sp. WMMC514]
MTDQIRPLVGLLDQVLGDRLLGAYLHGSAVLGGLRPASDIDVLAVAARTLTDRERRSLLDGLLAISGPAHRARPIELTVVVAAEVRPWRYPPTADFQYGEWRREAYLAGVVPRPETMVDLALVVAAVRAGDHPLAGPPPARLLGAVPRADVVRASVAGVPGLLDDLDGDTRNVLLTLARVWFTVATGEVRAKDVAADWALARLPPEHRPVLAHARRLYLHHRYEQERWSATLRAQVRPHVHQVLHHIGRAAGHGGFPAADGGAAALWPSISGQYNVELNSGSPDPPPVPPPG